MPAEGLMTTHSGRGPSPAARGPVRSAERQLAPDLARGAMLLFIALVNAPGLAPGGPAHGALLQSAEGAANALLSLFVHARAYPVFAIMFGYGLVQLARRQRAAGATPAQLRTLLLRRNAWLFVFGCAHAALLYFGDFLAAYGIIGAVATVVLLGRAKLQRAVLWLWAISIVELAVLTTLVVAGIARESGPAAAVPVEVPASSVAPSYLASIVARLHEWPMHTLTVLPAIFIVCLGMWAAERRMLEDPARHGALVRRIAVVCLSVAVAGGVPLALVHLGLVQADARTLSLISYLHKVSGMFGGPGYVALFALVAPWVSRNATSAVARIAGALAALGARSLSAYLLQSLAWQLLLPPYTLSLASRFGSSFLTALVVAVLVWLASVIGAAWLERRAWSGPAEMLLRRLVYGRAYERPHRATTSHPVGITSGAS
jgi:uncharacterized protein